MLEALFGLSRKTVENEPLKIFMALTDVERNRAKPLEPATVDRLAREYRTLTAQYPLFSEVPAITDKTILAYLETARAIDEIRDQGLARRCRRNLAGPGRTVADLRPPAEYSARCGGRDTGETSESFAKIQ